MSSRVVTIVVTLLAIGSLIAASQWRDSAFGIYNVDFDVSHSQVKEQAKQFVEINRDSSVSEYRSAAKLKSRSQVQAYLERTLGKEKTGVLANAGVPIWEYAVRFYQPQQKEEYQVRYTPGGEIAGFEHRIPEERDVSSVSQNQAKEQAKIFVENQTPHTISGQWEQISSETDDSLPSRTDYTFVWERDNKKFGNGVTLASASERIRVTMQEEQVGAYRYFVHVPEAWTTQFENQRGKNRIANTTARGIVLILFIIPAIIIFGRGYVRDTIRSKWPLILGGISAGIISLQGINSLPLVLFQYPTEQALGIFIAIVLVGALVGLLFQVGLLTVLTGIAGDIQQKISYPRLPSLQESFSWIHKAHVRNALWAGSVVFAFEIGFVTLYYALGSEYANFWTPGRIATTDAVGTYVPVLGALATGITAGISEEVVFRLFGISLYKRFLRYTILAVVFTAAVWAFGHAFYPQMPWYVRGVELTVVGSAWGWLYLRYGLLASVISHAMVNTFLGAFALWVTGATLNAVIGFAFVALPFVLWIIGGIWYRNQNSSESVKV